MDLRVYTVGHSTRSIDEVAALLLEHSIKSVVDVRRFPGSRLHPHFSLDALSASLAERGIGYIHKVDLGGRRSGGAGSVNSAWRNGSFRAYADYMATPPFAAALHFLVEHACGVRTALLCAEALPYRCHRRLIADALVVQGAEVIHIIGPRRSEPHRLHPQATLLPDGRLVYPEPEPVQTTLDLVSGSSRGAALTRPVTGR